MNTKQDTLRAASTGKWEPKGKTNRDSKQSTGK